MSFRTFLFAVLLSAAASSQAIAANAGFMMLHEPRADGLPPVDGTPVGMLDGNGAVHGPHIIDDGVAEAEASDHIEEEEDGDA